MAASFPGTLWTWTDQVDNVSAMDAADVNAPAAEIIAIETYLGAGSIVAGQFILNSAAGVDTWISLQTNSIEKWRVGSDESDSEKFKIHTGALADPSLFEMGSTGHIELTNVAETASDPSRHLYLQRVHTSALGSGKGLTGVEVRSTFNGSADALTSEVKGGEFKARHTTGNTYDVGTFKGVIGNVDCKNGTVTTGWAVEGAIDVSSGGTFTTAACFHGNLNNSGTVTNSYGVYVHGESGNVLTRGLYVNYATTGLYMSNVTTGIDIAACTTGINITGATTDAIKVTGTPTTSDITLHNGAMIMNTSADILTITEATIATVGKLQFGGATDWGTGATGTQITGAGYDWVSQTVGRVNTDLNNCAAAAAYHAMSVTADQTGSNTVLGTWTELYIKAGLNLPNSNNYVSVWGNLEIGADVETASISNCVTALLGSLTIGATYDNDARTCGCLVTMNYDNTGAAGSGRISAFEMSIANDVFDYGLYIPDSTVTTGIDIGDCSTAGIDITGDCGIALRIGAAGSGLSISSSRDYLAELTSASDTGAQAYNTNVGTMYVRHEIDAASELDSNSYVVASMHRMEIAGGNTDLSATNGPWITALMGYLKNPSGTVDANSNVCSAVNGTVNVGADWVQNAPAALYTCAFVAASYGDASADIRNYPAYLVVDLGMKEFTHGLYIEDDSCTTGINIGACTTGLTFTGTLATGISFYNATFVPDANRTDIAFELGSRADELTVNLANAASQNFEPFQMNINLTATGGAPTSTSTVRLIRVRSTHDTTDMSNLRIMNINTYMDVRKNIQAAYGQMNGVDFYTNAVAITTEAAVGVFNMECNSAVTGNVRGVIINVYGAGLPNTTSIGLEVRSDGGAATLAEGVRIWSVGSCALTTGLKMQGTLATCFDLENVVTGCDDTNTEGARNGRILVVDKNGDTKYILLYDGA